MLPLSALFLSVVCGGGGDRDTTSDSLGEHLSSFVASKKWAIKNLLQQQNSKKKPVNIRHSQPILPLLQLIDVCLHLCYRRSKKDNTEPKHFNQFHVLIYTHTRTLIRKTTTDWVIKLPQAKASNTTPVETGMELIWESLHTHPGAASGPGTFLGMMLQIKSHLMCAQEREGSQYQVLGASTNRA